MTCRLEILSDVVGFGVFIRLDGTELVVHPAERLTPPLIETLRTEKPQLIQILGAAHERCPHCGGWMVRDETFDGYDNRLCIVCGQWLQCVKKQQERHDSNAPPKHYRQADLEPGCPGRDGRGSQPAAKEGVHRSPEGL